MNPGPPQLAQNVHKLTQPHHTITPEGDLIKQAPLLDQLAGATHNSTRSRSGGSGGQGLPINTDAIDTQQWVNRCVRTNEELRTGQKHGTPHQIISRWPTEHRETWQHQLAQDTQQIINRIEHLLNPPPPRRPLRQPCPACDQQWATNTEGERKPALTARVYDTDNGVLPPSEWDLYCAACEAQWTPKDPTFQYMIESFCRQPENVLH